MFLLMQLGYAFMIAFYLLVIVLFTYVFTFADTEGKGMNGRISRFIYIHLPEEMSRLLSKCLGPTTYAKVAAIYDYVVRQRNPVMQIV